LKHKQIKNELDEIFIAPDFKDLSLAEMNKLSREHEKVSGELEEAEMRWLELQEEVSST